MQTYIKKDSFIIELNRIRHKAILFFIALVFANTLNSQVLGDRSGIDQIPASDSSLLVHYSNLMYDRLDIDSVAYFGEKAIEISKKMNNDSIYLNTLLNVGSNELYRGINDFGRRKVDEALLLSQRINDTYHYHLASLDRSDYYYQLDSLDKSISLAYEILELCLNRNDSALIYKCYHLLGVSFLKQKQLDLSLKYFQKSADVSKGYNRLVANGNAAITLLEMGRYEEALPILKKCIVENTYDDVLGMKGDASGYNSIADIFFNLKQYDSAAYYGLKSYDILTSIGDRFTLYYPTQTLSKIYLAWNKLDLAKKYAEEALEHAQSTNSLRLTWSSNEYLGRIHSKMKNFPSAYSYLNEAYILKDSVFNEDRSVSINELEVKFETSQKEAENDMLKMEKALQQETIKRQYVLLIAAILIVLIVTILLFFIWQLSKKRKKDATRIEEQNSQLTRQAEKLEHLDQTKSRFFANISHDLRTPLTLIDGFFQTLEKEDNLLTSNTKDAFSSAHRNLKLLDLFSDEIRDLTLLDSQQLTLKFQSVEIVWLVELNVSLFISLAEMKNIKLQFDTDISKGKKIRANVFNTERVLQNVIGNAIKYTQVGGEVNVKLTDQTDDHVLIQVSDNGPGITEDDLPHIFDRFYQSGKNDYYTNEGLGVGLALVKEIVKLHDGKVDVSSEMGKGTTFSIWLPYNLEKPESEVDPDKDRYVGGLEKMTMTQMPVSATSKVRLTKNTRSILIVEDHPEVLAYITSSIEDHYQILQATNGKEAITVIEQQKVDLIVTDLMMPLMDGFELIDFMKGREDLRHIEVMVISAKTDSDTRSEVLDKGINDFLSKPFSAAELNQRISNLINRSEPDTFRELATEKGHLSDIEQNLVGKLNSYILSRIDDPNLGVENLADLLNTSERNVHRIIKQLTEYSPKAYIRRIRIDYAESLLKNRKVKSVKAACKAVGLSNANSFATQFKKQKGVAPSELLPQGQ